MISHFIFTQAVKYIVTASTRYIILYLNHSCSLLLEIAPEYVERLTNYLRKKTKYKLLAMRGVVMSRDQDQDQLLVSYEYIIYRAASTRTMRDCGFPTVSEEKSRSFQKKSRTYSNLVRDFLEKKKKQFSCLNLMLFVNVFDLYLCAC